MNVNTPQALKFFSIQFTKNEFPPPSSTAKVINQETSDVIRQIPSQPELDFRKSMTENSIIDIYV